MAIVCSCGSCHCFFQWEREENKKQGKPSIFYDVQISRILKKKASLQGQRPSIKWTHRGRRCIVMVSTHMAYFRLENENLFSSEHCTHFTLRSESWISIHSDKNLPTLDNPSHFLQKRPATSSRLRIYFKYNYPIQD